MRRLPPPHDPDERKHGTLVPRAMGLVIGLLLGYLLFSGSASEPAASPSLAARH